MTATLAGLLAALAGAPALPGAACRGHGDTFDPRRCGESDTDADTRHRTALAMCHRCPALSRCRDWLAATPPSLRPRGVVAGRIVDDRGTVRLGRGLRPPEAVAS
jgi:hypothetical protein